MLFPGGGGVGRSGTKIDPNDNNNGEERHIEGKFYRKHLSEMYKK